MNKGIFLRLLIASDSFMIDYVPLLRMKTAKWVEFQGLMVARFSHVKSFFRHCCVFHLKCKRMNDTEPLTQNQWTRYGIRVHFTFRERVLIAAAVFTVGFILFGSTFASFNYFVVKIDIEKEWNHSSLVKREKYQSERTANTRSFTIQNWDH